MTARDNVANLALHLFGQSGRWRANRGYQTSQPDVVPIRSYLGGSLARPANRSLDSAIPDGSARHGPGDP
jgi:hypothetical protein